MSVASMSAFLGATGHAEGLTHVVTRNPPSRKLSVFDAEDTRAEVDEDN